MSKIYLSQKTAAKELTAVGFTGAAARAALAKMRKTAFGKREKVKADDVRRVIALAAQPTPIVSTRSYRPIVFRESVL